MAVTKTDHTRIFLWIIIRSKSTALTKCMSFVDDTQVWMEPYMSCFLNETVYNPGFKKGDQHAEKMRENLKKNEESEEMKRIRADMAGKIAKTPGIIEQHKISYSWVKDQLEMPELGKKFIFIKDQSCAIDSHLSYLPEAPCRHVFLIRHPRELFVSFKETASKRTLLEGIPWEDFRLDTTALFYPVKDLYKIHHRVWKHFSRDPEFDPIIIDAHDLASKPEVVLPKYFERLGIPFRQSYLEWEDGDAVLEKWKGSADMIFLEAKTITTSKALNSSKFIAPKGPRGTPSKPELRITEELEEYIEDAMPYYEEMYTNRLH